MLSGFKEWFSPMKLDKEQRLLLVVAALVWMGMVIVDFSFWPALSCYVAALPINVYLLLQHVQITIGRFTIGRIR